MNAEYRTAELANAKTEATRCRLAYETAKRPGDKRRAAEALEFWTNKASFLANPKIEA